VTEQGRLNFARQDSSLNRYRDPGDIGVSGSPIFVLVSTDETWVSA
jgi:hypothetical protein